ncbi:hypothetical protein, partial [Paraburkholderia steynii]|uniref:hypothetical protein n=1 Tax=Paraburkholderia steynii TaxID=1245441 RepID=UPI001ABE7E87
LAVLAAFFCLLFFAAAKKSRCRPAQGRRLKHANKPRMPAKSPKNQTGRQRKDQKQPKPLAQQIPKKPAMTHH